MATDPFASIGGGVEIDNGGWIPKNIATQEQIDAYNQKQGGGTPAPTAPPPDPYSPPPPAPSSPPPADAGAGSDPFASIGGGVYQNGGWIPKGMASPTPEAPAAAPAPAAPTAAPAPTSPDPFASIGGGIFANGGWIPKGMATPEQIAAAGQPAGGALAPVPGAPAAPGTDPRAPAQGTGAIGGAGEVTGPGSAIVGQARGSETQSATPGAPPTQSTTNQGTQDTVRNSYLERAVQPLNVDPNDPIIQQQVQPFAAAQERGRRQTLSEAAERASAKGLGDSGALDAERRLAGERAGQATGLFESQLVGKEIETRRDEIKDALVNLKGMLSDDQVRALQKEMAELDAAVKKLGIAAGTDTASSEIALKRQLGLGGMNIDLMRLLMQDRQFADTMGFNVADREAFYNNAALQNLMPR
jgi:hypothetical protein